MEGGTIVWDPFYLYHFPNLSEISQLGGKCEGTCMLPDFQHGFI